MKLKIKKLHPDAVIPKYQTKGASAFDFHALEDCFIPKGEKRLIKTGLSFEIPSGYELQVRPRSGTSLKTELQIANSPGTVDSDFRGEVCVIAKNSQLFSRSDGTGSDGTIYIKKGDRIAQGAICPVLQVEFEEVEGLSETERGSSGYGSTGSK